MLPSGVSTADAAIANPAMSRRCASFFPRVLVSVRQDLVVVGHAGSAAQRAGERRAQRTDGPGGDDERAVRGRLCRLRSARTRPYRAAPRARLLIAPSPMAPNSPPNPRRNQVTGPLEADDADEDEEIDREDRDEGDETEQHSHVAP